MRPADRNIHLSTEPEALIEDLNSDSTTRQPTPSLANH
jgi:hypothetical protein